MIAAASPRPARFRFRRLVSYAALVFLLTLQPALARRHVLHSPYPPSQTSSIIIDAQTGKVLSEHDADRPDYPASLTKMMTLYLTFGALEQGKVSLNDLFTVSLHASRQVPSKLGLRPNERISLRDLILAIVTHSANDAAVTIAENLAGSESAFAQRMTATAHALGMTATTFRNASGLPSPPNISTARDLATLARALWRDYPKEYRFFATEQFTFNGAVYETHNHLMESFAGMDGIKTGYIHASGFNLAASAVRNGRRLIGVIMGGSSAHARDLQMANLLDDGFAGINPVDTTIRTASSDDGTGNTLATRAASTIAALSPVGRAEAAVPARARTAKLGHHARRKPEAAHAWAIQVGAFSKPEAAERAGAIALTRLRLKGKTAHVLPPGPADKEPLYRARIAGFSHTQAERACRSLRAKLGHKLCAVIPPMQAVAAEFPTPATLDLSAPQPTDASAN
ncbi:MAG: D-alanyl-D-alanine carboxypeptidase [Alphaproteobacteria bacterium]|nr:D-alanyl-D-alanine carboxypeptidase [Alphaproteobacteria bacterium]